MRSGVDSSRRSICAREGNAQQMKAQFHPAASDEIVETTAYYEGEVPGLGVGFITEVEKVIGVLSDQPEIGQRVGEQFRRIILARFP